MACPSCKGDDVGEIGFSTVRQGVAFHYCRHCEHRWWLSAGGKLPLTQVLEAATVLARG